MPKLKVWFLCLVICVLCGWIVHIVNHELKTIEARQVVFQIIGPCPESTKFRSYVAQELRNIKDEIQESHETQDWSALESKIRQLQKLIDQPMPLIEEPQPIQSLVVLIDARSLSLPEISNLIRSAKNYKVILGLTAVQNISVDKKSVITVLVPRCGQIWNELIRHVGSSEYILIGLDITVIPNVIVTRHHDVIALPLLINNRWNIECWNTRIRNYRLYFEKNDNWISNRCLTCDHIKGPFIVRRSVLEKYPLVLNDVTSDDVAFADWFLRLKEVGIQTVLCIDGTTIHDKEKVTTTREQWLPFVLKWKVINIFSPEFQFSFACKETGISCHPKKVAREFLLSPCCVEQVDRAVRSLDHFSQLEGVKYEMDSGLTLGSVKLRNLAPWDLDGDGGYLTTDYQTYKTQGTTYFQTQNFTLTDFVEPTGNNSYFQINTPDLYIEMFGCDNLTNGLYVPDNMKVIATRAMFGGTWMVSHVNPGLFTRNRYGYNCLRHSQSWIVFGSKDSSTEYIPGRWRPCSRPMDHTCLNQYSTDGSVEFQEPTIIL